MFVPTWFEHSPEFEVADSDSHDGCFIKSIKDICGNRELL